MLDEIPFTKRIIQTLSIILPRTRFFLLLVGALFYIYAILGVELFCFLRNGNEIDGFNQSYSDFISALLSLVKFSILESPIDQIKDAMQTSKPNFICFEITTY